MSGSNRPSFYKRRIRMGHARVGRETPVATTYTFDRRESTTTNPTANNKYYGTFKAELVSYINK